MAIILTMPKLSPTMEEGTLVKWHKKIGDRVQAGDLLFEVATDKATVEYPSLDEGYLRSILIQEGMEAQVNQPVALLTEELSENIEAALLSLQTRPAPPPPALTAQTDALPSASPSSIKPKQALEQPNFAPEPPLKNYTFEYPSESIGRRILASPLAKKIAQDKGLDLSTVKGTGPHQRIMKRDLEKAQPLAGAVSAQREIPTLPPGTYEELPLSPMRKTIAQRLQQAKSFIPHFYLSLKIDAGPLAALKEQLHTQLIKLSINDFVLRATALALRQHPEINRGFYAEKQCIIQFKTIDLAVAVNIEGGLVTPIISHADYKSIREISLEVRHLIQKAKEGKLEPRHYKGGSFTLSNLGMYGIAHFQAILNPPQAAILAVGAIQDVPVIKNGLVQPGKQMDLTLSADHRVIDGGMGAIFLQTLKQYLENPGVLIINS